jgi:hypothetical protein
MQTLAIPGTIMLSLLAGGLYGVVGGSFLVATVSTLGSCSCYCLSAAFGQPLAHALWPQQLEKYAAEVARRRRQLFNYIVFLRVTPILPNTFINVASPIVGVPLAPFALGERPLGGLQGWAGLDGQQLLRHFCRPVNRSGGDHASWKGSASGLAGAWGWRASKCQDCIIVLHLSSPLTSSLP